LISDAANVPAISVVVGAKNAEATIRDCLDSLCAQAKVERAEIIVVDGSGDGTAELVAAYEAQIKLIRCGPEALIPQLWKAGMEAANAPIVAFTIGQCIPTSDWLSQIGKALAGPAAAVGGPLYGPEGKGGRDWGLYFSRYSRFLPPGTAGPIDDIAGDNAAYKRVALETCRQEWVYGFWENLVNASLVADGMALRWEPGMIVSFGRAEKVGDIVRVRFRHGQHYASTRIGNTLVKRGLRMAAAPLLVPVLLGRIYGRVKQERPDWIGNFWRSLPVILIILAAWSAGEMSGYAVPKPQDR
jgi:glycosyltransferase involved in cell wall biosynthesis